jgi:hypothetical protein
MKKLFLIALLPAFVMDGCRKDITSINTDPKNPATVPSYALFTNAERTFASTLASSNVNLNVFRLITQQWQETTYTDESNYDLTTRNIPRGLWNTLYRDVLTDLREAKRLIPKDVVNGDGSANAGKQKNELAITEMIEIYTWYYLLTTFGNIPYSEALDINNPFPKYDDAKTVYNDLLTRLDAAIGQLDPSAESFGSADVIYNGAPDSWRKFGNSLKLKMGMLIADKDEAKAKSIVESAVAGGVFQSNDDNAMFKFQQAPPNTNPVWVDLVQTGRKDFVAASTVVDELLRLKDPRTPYYITRDASGAYSGGTPGASSNYATYSKPSGPLLVSGSIGKITNPDFPGDLLDYSEVEFYLAEAVERGFNVGGTAAEHYNNAVKASILFWGGTEAEANAYLAQPSVAYNSATGDWRQKIGLQKWLALYNRGWDAWIEWRRLDAPMLEAPADALSDVPVRFTYSVDEQNVNTANYEAASTAIGGDEVSTKLWWDVN